MNIDKNVILDMLHGNGQHTEADQAAQQLPDQVDTDQHAGLLSKLGVSLPALLARFSGAGSSGGGGLGGLFSSGSGGGLGAMLGGLGGEQQPTRTTEQSQIGAVDEDGEPATGTQPSSGLGGLFSER